MTNVPTWEESVELDAPSWEESAPIDQPSYGQRVSATFAEAGLNIADVLTRMAERQPSDNPFNEDLEALYDTLEIGGEVATAGGSLFGEAYKSLPETTRKTIEKYAGAGAESLYNALNIGGALDLASKEVKEFSKEHPKQAEAIEDAAQIAGMVGMSKAALNLGSKATIHKWSDVVLPAPTAKELKRRALYSKATVLGTDVPVVTKQQKKMIRLLKDTKGVHPSNRNQVNVNAVINNISNRAERLQAGLRKSKVKISPDEISDNLIDDLYRNFDDNPIFDGATDNELKRAYERAMRFVKESDGSPDGLWKARQKLDAFYEFHKGERFVNGSNNASQASEAYRIARNTMNKVLESKVPGARKSLEELSILYDARDLLVDKAILDDPTLIGRMMDKASKIVTIRPPVIRGGFYSPQGSAK